MLTIDQILAASDLPIEKVEVPEWGGAVYVRTMTGTERDAFEMSIVDGKRTNLANIRARFCAKIMSDDKGNRICTDEQATALGKKSSAALDRIYAVGQRLNGMTKADAEELAKNSGAGQAGNSTSTSPSPLA